MNLLPKDVEYTLSILKKYLRKENNIFLYKNSLIKFLEKDGLSSEEIENVLFVIFSYAYKFYCNYTFDWLKSNFNKIYEGSPSVSMFSPIVRELEGIISSEWEEEIQSKSYKNKENINNVIEFLSYFNLHDFLKTRDRYEIIRGLYEALAESYTEDDEEEDDKTDIYRK